MSLSLASFLVLFHVSSAAQLFFGFLLSFRTHLFLLTLSPEFLFYFHRSYPLHSKVESCRGEECCEPDALVQYIFVYFSTFFFPCLIQLFFLHQILIPSPFLYLLSALVYDILPLLTFLSILLFSPFFLLHVFSFSSSYSTLSFFYNSFS